MDLKSTLGCMMRKHHTALCLPGNFIVGNLFCVFPGNFIFGNLFCVFAGNFIVGNLFCVFPQLRLSRLIPLTGHISKFVSYRHLLAGLPPFIPLMYGAEVENQDATIGAASVRDFHPVTFQ